MQVCTCRSACLGVAALSLYVVHSLSLSVVHSLPLSVCLCLLPCLCLSLSLFLSPTHPPKFHPPTTPHGWRRSERNVGIQFVLLSNHDFCVIWDSLSYCPAMTSVWYETVCPIVQSYLLCDTYGLCYCSAITSVWYDSLSYCPAMTSVWYVTVCLIVQPCFLFDTDQFALLSNHDLCVIRDSSSYCPATTSVKDVIVCPIIQRWLLCDTWQFVLLSNYDFCVKCVCEMSGRDCPSCPHLVCCLIACPAGEP